MEDREKRRKAQRDAVIGAVLKKRAQSYGKTPGYYDDDIREVVRVVDEVLEAQESVRQAEEAAPAPVRQQQPDRQQVTSAPVNQEAAAAADSEKQPAPMRPVRTRSSEETMVFVIKTSAIRDKKGGDDNE
jgi:hypothetical protein